MNIIAISGKARNGKDTFANLLKDALEEDGSSVLIAHYADAVKYVCRTFFGWDGVKDEYGRSLLQYVGTDIVRKQQPDFWVKFLSDILCMFSDEWEYVLIPDVRFPNEIEYMRRAGFPVTHLRVTRPGFDNGLSEQQKSHPSETALDDCMPDAVIYNSGSLEDLKDSAIRWIKEYHHEEKQLL